MCQKFKDSPKSFFLQRIAIDIRSLLVRPFPTFISFIDGRKFS